MTVSVELNFSVLPSKAALCGLSPNCRFAPAEISPNLLRCKKVVHGPFRHMPRCTQTSAFGPLRKSWNIIVTSKASNALCRRPERQPLAEPPRIRGRGGWQGCTTGGRKRISVLPFHLFRIGRQKQIHVVGWGDLLIMRDGLVRGNTRELAPDTRRA